MLINFKSADEGRAQKSSQRQARLRVRLLHVADRKQVRLLQQALKNTHLTMGKRSSLTLGQEAMSGHRECRLEKEQKSLRYVAS